MKFTANVLLQSASIREGRRQWKKIQKCFEYLIPSLTKQREKYWMLNLRTVYLHSLKDRTGDKYRNEKPRQLLDKCFPPT